MANASTTASQTPAAGIAASDSATEPSSVSPMFAGPGEMSALCRAFDWASTPLGPVNRWSASLRAAAGIVLHSRNPMLLFWGPELIQIYNDAFRLSLGGGGRHPRALGMRAREFWTDAWDIVGPQIDRVMSLGEGTWHEDRHIPIERNGRLEDVWWTYSYTPVRDDDGRIGGTLVVCLETTRRVLADRERERLDAARRESEERLRAIYDGTYEYIGLITPDGTVVDVNRASLEFARNRREDVVGRAFWDTPWFTNTPGAPERLRDAIARAAKGEFVRYELPLRRPSGKVTTLDFSLYPIRNERGEVIFIVPEGRDVSDRERLVRQLRVERKRLAHAFRQAPAFLAVLRGPEHVFELVNDAYYQLVGHRELVGRPAFEALPELRGQPFRELLDRVLLTGEPFVGRELSVLVARTAGAPPEERFLDLIFTPLVEGDGTRSGIIAHGTDVTAQVLARREVERLLHESERARADAEAARADAEVARADAEAASRAKGDFLAVMSHELRTPLNAIGGYAELLEMGIRGPITPTQQEDLRRIQASQRHLLGLINEVLNYAKLETGTVHFEVQDVLVLETVVGAEALVAPQARAKGLALTVSAIPRTVAARADGEKVRQILVNLLSNAIKFTDRGGRIDVDYDTQGERVHIIVRDTGVGIPPDKLNTVFEPFVQVRSDYRRPAEGTGLGLAISRDLARGMGGDLTVVSTVGAGSAFSLSLPAGPPPALAHDVGP